MTYRKIFVLFVVGCAIISCQSNPENTKEIFSNPFVERVMKQPGDFYYFNPNSIHDSLHHLPIGMFDSGTGGLTVLNALVNFDRFSNTTSQYLTYGDGLNDFLTESFIYFGDQANMPYGNYYKMGKSGYLKELVLKDALFLLGDKYYQNPSDSVFQTNKKSVKMVVIACNTATAYAKREIEEMLAASGTNLKVIGVIDAGVRGALATFGANESGTLAVLATAGTVASNGYVNAFEKLIKESGHIGTIQIVQQACMGVAEAIDEEPNFIDRKAVKPREAYNGPGLDSPELKIEKDLLKIYNFDMAQNALLCDSPGDDCNIMQLNSPENYMKYYLVQLCERLRKQPDVKPLKTIILGCTHYPYLSGFIHKTLKELYDLKIDGEFVYRNVLSDSIILIDPAINTAKEVYTYLADNNLLNPTGKISESEFYISEPALPNPDTKSDSPKRFSYAYKYGRAENQPIYDVRQVPVSKKNMPEEIVMRLQRFIPEVFSLIREFNQNNPKTKFLRPEDRL
jgi:glutamate racemase